MATEQKMFTAALNKFFLGSPEATREDTHTRNLARLLNFFQDQERRKPRTTLDAIFDSGDAGPDFITAPDSDPDRITPADLVGVTLVSKIDIDSLWQGHLHYLTHFLESIPTDHDLHQLTNDQYNKWVGPDSAGQQIRQMLQDDIGLGRYGSFTVMARKRPRLFPHLTRPEDILDTPTNWWELWYVALRDSTDVVNELHSLKNELAQSVPAAHGVSLLRIADIALWNSGSDN